MQIHPIAFHGQTGNVKGNPRPDQGVKTDAKSHGPSHNEAWHIRWRVGKHDRFQTFKVSLSVACFGNLA
jgi:hypothetical protein